MKIFISSVSLLASYLCVAIFCGIIAITVISTIAVLADGTPLDDKQVGALIRVLGLNFMPLFGFVFSYALHLKFRGQIMSKEMKQKVAIITSALVMQILMEQNQINYPLKIHLPANRIHRLIIKTKGKKGVCLSDVITICRELVEEGIFICNYGQYQLAV